MSKIIIGIDPGHCTGYAEWNPETRALSVVRSCRTDEAMLTVLQLHESGILQKVVFEDARLRTGYFGENSRAKQQGAGSIKRDCGAWADFRPAGRLTIMSQGCHSDSASPLR